MYFHCDLHSENRIIFFAAMFPPGTERMSGNHNGLFNCTEQAYVRGGRPYFKQGIDWFTAARIIRVIIRLLSIIKDYVL